MIKRKLSLALTVLLSLTAFAACGNKDSDNNQSATESSAGKTTESTSVTTTVTLPDISVPSVGETSLSSPLNSNTVLGETSTTVTNNPVSDISQQANNKDNKNDNPSGDTESDERNFDTVKKLFPFITDEGVAKGTAVQNEAAIEAAGVYKIEDVSPENIEANTDNRTLFRLGIKNTEGLLKYKEKYYIPTKIKDQTYMVVFGDENTTTPEEIAPYARKNSHTAYYGYAIKSGSGYAFIPLIAGSDESGYFIVKPAFKYIGFDMTDMPDLSADTIIGTGLNDPIQIE